MKNLISTYFEFNKLNTNYKTEILSGITIFLSMSYLLILNPSILSLSSVEGLPSGVGMDKDSVFVATALTAAFGTLIVGIVSKYPLAIAPSIGINTLFAYTIVLNMGISWETALAATLMTGILIMILTITGMRQMIINSIPNDLKLAVASGIGILITYIGFSISGIFINNEPSIISLSGLSDPNTYLSILGLCLIIILMIKGYKAAMLLGTISTIIIGTILGILEMPNQIISVVPSLKPTFGVALINFNSTFNKEVLLII